MDLGKLIKGIVVLAIVVFAWKVLLPWVQKQQGASSTSTSKSSSDSPCVRSAERASSTWGSGLGRFVNPPYDIEAWSRFRSDVDSGIGAAESACSCSEESCTTTRTAMRDLGALVAEFDTSIRNGSSPPDDAVQRQASIDDRITQADELRRSGK